MSDVGPERVRGPRLALDHLTCTCASLVPTLYANAAHHAASLTYAPLAQNN